MDSGEGGITDSSFFSISHFSVLHPAFHALFSISPTFQHFTHLALRIWPGTIQVSKSR